MIVNTFRGRKIPKDIKTKTQLIKHVLVTEREEEPISNGEFVFELMCTRFGGVLHDLRVEGWNIITLPGKEKGHFKYLLVDKPDDKRRAKMMGKNRAKKLAKV